MAVRTIPVNAIFRLTDMQDKVFQSFHRMRPNISRTQAEMVMDAVANIRNSVIGNGYLTVTTELREEQ
jgi:hypothetical protein